MTEALPGKGTKGQHGVNKDGVQAHEDSVQWAC